MYVRCTLARSHVSRLTSKARTPHATASAGGDAARLLLLCASLPLCCLVCGVLSTKIARARDHMAGSLRERPSDQATKRATSSSESCWLFLLPTRHVCVATTAAVNSAAFDVLMWPEWLHPPPRCFAWLDTAFVVATCFKEGDDTGAAVCRASSSAASSPPMPDVLSKGGAAPAGGEHRASIERVHACKRASRTEHAHDDERTSTRSFLQLLARRRFVSPATSGADVSACGAGRKNDFG